MAPNGTVEPRLSRGLRDLLPEQMLARQWMIDTIRGVYELYGFVPLSTPAVEYLDVLRGSAAGQEASSSIFTVSNPEEEALGLRFDLTVPLARVISQYKDLPRPFRRYQVSPVWRADKPGPGRYREFTQFDLDSVGVESEIADTEIIAGMCDTLTALNVGGYRVRFSSRSLLNLLLSFAGIPAEQGVDVFRVLDKMDKVGMAKVRLELTEGYVDSSGDPIRGLGLQNEQVDKIEQFLAIPPDDRRQVIARLRETFASVEGAEEELAKVERISDHLYALGYDNDRVSLDVSVARGLAYYTGPVFEAILLDDEGKPSKFGSIFGGGRYDDLVNRFLGERVPAVGASIGVDRLLAALIDLGRLPLKKATSQVLVTRMDPALEGECLAMVYELRRAGIPAELYLGTAKGPGKQLKYADQWGIPIVVLYGSTEKESGNITLKDMEVGRRKAETLARREEWLEERPGQRVVAKDALVATVREMLGGSK
ncbi:MAG: histidyl-tRNA synthetase [Acidobacteriota bacterium]|jgi:histidyl-tRNA synthetase|nr:histidyl-tRNA synthetase [Acidobacteriota bacterium]